MLPRPSCFGVLCACPNKSGGELLVLCSSALRSVLLSEDLFATSASADFSVALTPEISPGKVCSLSARATRLYMTSLSVTVGFHAS